MKKAEPREDGRPQLAVIKGSEIEAKAYQAHQLRVQGCSWTEVAEQLGYASRQSAETEVRRYLGRAAAMMDREQREQALALEMDRLDALLNAVWAKAMDGDTKAVDSAIRIVATRARILGLEAMPQANVTHNTVVVTGAKTEDYVQTLKQLAGSDV